MVTVICVFMLCLSALIALRMRNEHLERHTANAECLDIKFKLLMDRVERAEARVNESYNPDAFAKLESQVNALRVRAGIRG